MEERVHLHNLPQQNNRLSCVKLLKRRQYECVLLARIETELARIHTQIHTYVLVSACRSCARDARCVERCKHELYVCVRASSDSMSMCEVDAR
jgi:hypothetical protein